MIFRKKQNESVINSVDYQDCLDYIENYWPSVTCYVPDDQGTRIGLPNKFVSPSNKLFEHDQFYWDSYFTIMGLLAAGKNELAKGMVDNLVHLASIFGLVPSRNRLYNLGISQPPFLTSMILEIFKIYQDKAWLKEAAEAAEKELKGYWENSDHMVFEGLSRYCDHFWTHTTAEHESGWDMTSRFHERCLDYLPIDLNCCLYKYETDLAEIFRLLGDHAKADVYSQKAEARRKTIIDLMWSRGRRFFFDFNYLVGRQSDFYSLAGFYPMWSGVATQDQARRMVKTLRKFENRGGLVNTQEKGLRSYKIYGASTRSLKIAQRHSATALKAFFSYFRVRRNILSLPQRQISFPGNGMFSRKRIFKQWDYPNGWAPQQYIVISGLLRYGYHDDAKRLAKKWLDLNKKVFQATGQFWEKYNVVDEDIGKEGRYPNQTGFGWTNAVFVWLVKEFSSGRTVNLPTNERVVSLEKPALQVTQEQQV